MTDTFAATLATIPCGPVDRFATFRLEDPVLGSLDLTAPGYVVSEFVVGHPAERPVERNRALNDGAYDQTEFLGGRAVTWSLMLDTRVLPMQTLLDRFRPYMSPRRRPLLVWSYLGTPDELRTLSLRGVDCPVAVSGSRSRFPTLPCSWKSPWAYMRGYEQQCVTIVPSAAAEAGRTYPLTFDRTYPAQLPVGAFEVYNGGGERADWRATIVVGPLGTVVDPALTVNGVDFTLDELDGLTMTAGQTLVIDTAERTVLLNDDPDEPRYDRVNYLDWNWEDLQLRPGSNLVRFQHTGTSTEAFATICWDLAWL